MILILSNHGDTSTDIVSDWLNYYKKTFIRINSDDIIDEKYLLKLTNGNIEIKMNDKRLSFEDINVVWMRKFGNFKDTTSFKTLVNTNKYRFDLVELLQNEYRRVVVTIFIMLQNKKWLTKYTSTRLNKLQMLRTAYSCGLSIPDTIVTNYKDILDKNKRYISKSLENTIDIRISEEEYGVMYTSSINTTQYKLIPSKFAPSLIQEEIIKEYELRIFYLCGKLYPMAIFSQDDDQTKTDFRKYNNSRPNRFVPCKIDDKTAEQIKVFMNKIDLNCGSLDFIKSKNGKLYFLEVNPTGQFGMVDFPCNYGLHQKVAETLIKMDTK